MSNNKIFEIGEWVRTEDGIGQVLYNREVYFQEFHQYTRQGKKGEFIKMLYICKILCGFDGKIKNRFKINTYISISSIYEKEKKYIEQIRLKQHEKYVKYILYEPKKV